ncbi:MAG: hypothetical protein H7Y30_14220 [Pyrinomonadaceae bacterium]|nr:hypothetical protein [Pyrinomonadaceae bacterium]
MNVRIKLSMGVCLLALAGLGVGCSGDSGNANANANATNPTTADANVSPANNPTLAQNPTGTDPTQTMSPQPAPPVVRSDGSEVQTSMGADGVVTETRTFKNNKNVTKVIRTTNGTNRTAKVYNAKGQSKDLPKDKVETAMDETGDALAAAAGWTVEKTKDAAAATKDGATVVGEKTVEGARTVGEKTAEGAKKVGEKTVEGAKKGARAVKDAVTP